MAKRKTEQKERSDNRPLDEHNETLVEVVLRVLNMANLFKKARFSETEATWWLQGTIAEAYIHSINFVVPNRPVRFSNASSKVKLILPGLMPMLGKGGSLQSRQAIIHSLVHTDSWVIDFSWVAQDEGRHFTLLTATTTSQVSIQRKAFESNRA